MWTAVKMVTHVAADHGHAQCQTASGTGETDDFRTSDVDPKSLHEYIQTLQRRSTSGVYNRQNSLRQTWMC